ncbi:sodium channel subunit beta-2-like [Hoplias malabaricus]|uniref:sodium channel subunit beta-2-like n=1 Tax=Hoplias malabaricus TaxID=27720 RepID=UPI003462661D
MWLLLLLPCVRADSRCKSDLISSINITAKLQSDILLPCNFELTLFKSDMTADIASVWRESPCKSELVLSLNVTTALQSDVLLPCNFSPGLIGLNTTADIAAVWSHRNMTVNNLVEITLQGQTMYWKNYNRQIKTFSSVSASGNFSILLRNVTQSDEGLYQCDLFNGTGCRIAYQEMHLRFDDSPADGFLTWLVTAGALGGGVVLLVFLITIYICAKRSTNSSNESVSRELYPPEVPHDAVEYTLENPIYDAAVQSETHSSFRAEKGNSAETAVYTAVKKVKRKERKPEEVQ